MVTSRWFNERQSQVTTEIAPADGPNELIIGATAGTGRQTQAAGTEAGEGESDDGHHEAGEVGAGGAEVRRLPRCGWVVS